MDGNTPIFSSIIKSFNLEWNDFKRCLRGVDRETFADLINHAQKHVEAGSDMSGYNPFETVVMSILVENEKTLRKLREYVKRKDFKCDYRRDHFILPFDHFPYFCPGGTVRGFTRRMGCADRGRPVHVCVHLFHG